MNWCLKCACDRYVRYYEAVGMRIVEVLGKDLETVEMYAIPNDVDLIDVVRDGHYNILGRYKKGTKVHTCNTVKTANIV